MPSESTHLSPDEAKELVRRWWMALGNNDTKYATELLADDIVWEIKFVGTLLPFGGISRGKEEATKNAIEMTGILYDAGRLRFEITNMVSDGKTVVMEFLVDGYTSRGVRYDNVEYISVIELENGKVKHVREYPDALKAKEAHFL